MLIPDRLMPHGGLVSYRPAVGNTGKGRALAPTPVTPDRACIQDKRRYIRGPVSDVVSTATVWLDPEHEMPLGSEVTLWVGYAREYTTTVLEVRVHEHGPGLPAHVELLLK